VDPDIFENDAWAWYHKPGMSIQIISDNKTMLAHDAESVKNTYDLAFLGPVTLDWKSAAKLKVTFTVNQKAAEKDINPFDPLLLDSGQINFVVPATDDEDYKLRFHVKLFEPKPSRPEVSTDPIASLN